MHDTPKWMRRLSSKNQIIERYLMGRLPLQVAQDFERYCRANPDAVVQLGLPDRSNAALRLLDAAGQPEPWTRRPPPQWQRWGKPVAQGWTRFSSIR